MNSSKLEEIQQLTRVDNNGGRGGGGSCWRRSQHRSRDEHGRNGEAGISNSDGVLWSRRREHPNGYDEREWGICFNGSRRRERERRVIGGGEGTRGSEEGSRSRRRRGGEWLPWTQIVGGRTATLPIRRRFRQM